MRSTSATCASSMTCVLKRAWTPSVYVKPSEVPFELMLSLSGHRWPSDRQHGGKTQAYQVPSQETDNCGQDQGGIDHYAHE